MHTPSVTLAGVWSSGLSVPEAAGGRLLALAGVSRALGHPGPRVCCLLFCGHPVPGEAAGGWLPAQLSILPPCVSSEVAGAPVSEISGPFSTDDLASSCVPAPALPEPTLWLISYALMSVCGAILLTLIALLLLPLRCRQGARDPEVVNDESSLVRHRWK